MLDVPKEMPSQPMHRGNDERGMALSTLIITAAMASLALVAGVVVISVTRSVSNDLADQAPSLKGNSCNVVEVYDIGVAAQGSRGSREGNEGSAVGCLPVCTLTFASRQGEILADTGFRVQMPIAMLEEVRRYSYDEAHRLADKLKRAYPGISEYGNSDGVQLEGSVWIQELIGKTVLMQDATHFFAQGVAGGLTFHENVPVFDGYGRQGVRAAPARNDCEVYALLG